MMDTPYTYRIRIQGHIDSSWSMWFDGLTVTNLTGGEAELVGPLPDQTALHGILARIRDLGIPLVALRRLKRTTSCVENGDGPRGFQPRLDAEFAEHGRDVVIDGALGQA
jgi:hypothetical protein